ncbi:MAG TPA: flagellar basal body P-ring formation chaperone FlgA [Burkholderiales bacterium]|nr:flagellar basal body P-ring formation chaperone FlgA [Burkholderiales bacterium]
MKSLLTNLTLAALLLAAAAGGVRAQNPAQQSPVAVQRAVEDFLRVQTSGLAGQATFTTGAVDPKLALPACGSLEVFMPAGARLWGNGSVGVRCGAPTPWTVYVPVTVRVQGPYLAAARSIPAGQALAQEDLTVMQGDLTKMPPSIVTDMAQALGKTVGAPLAPGQPLRADVLRVVPAILQGQTVKLISQGPGFRVSADGKALANAAVGQLAQIRTSAGQTVSGIARADGTVEIAF